MEIGIVGLGLIGGSLGIDFKQIGHRVLGVSRRSETCEQAIVRQVVDDASTDYDLLATAEVVFICTPLAAMADTLDKLLPHLAQTAIVTDVGSVKTSVVETLAPRWPNFVGGHPMSGKAEAGLDAAQARLFEGNAYVLTPTEGTPPESVEVIADLAQSLGSRLYHCSADQHDCAVAWISHLPVMVSAGLIQACSAEADPAVLELAQALASSGFRDTSRVGGGHPELGVMMARYNQGELLRSLSAYRYHLDDLIHQIEQQDWQGLEQSLQATQDARPRFTES